MTCGETHREGSFTLVTCPVQGYKKELNLLPLRLNRGYPGPQNLATKCNDGYTKSKDPGCQAFFPRAVCASVIPSETRPLGLPCLHNKVVIVNS